MNGWFLKAIGAAIPLVLGALATIAWQNSHLLIRMGENQSDIRRDLDNLQANLVPGSELRVRLTQDEREIQRLRDLADRLAVCPQPTKQ
jgi:hypothetical protein